MSTRMGRRSGWAAALLLLLSAAGCGSLPTQERPGAPSYGQTREMFVAGYGNIESVYIDPVDHGRLALAGLERLSTIDPRLAVERSADEVTLLLEGRQVAVFGAPRPEAAGAWGVLTADLVQAARSASPAVHDMSGEDLYEGVFEGIVSGLDGISRYASAKAAFENRVSREGFGGIGVRIAVEEDAVRIVSVMHYTPAERIGLRADDLITRIDGRPVAGLEQETVVELLRGPVGSRVALELVRDGKPLALPLTTTRAHIVPETVVYHREGDVGYLRIYSFNLETAQSLRKELAYAQQDIGANRLRGYILDLRGNPGGLLDQAVAVADLFLEQGRIVSTHGRHPDSHQYFEASAGDYGKGQPIVVLMNGNSASAAEIVAAALQDSGRAVVVGSNSYGKGTVQTVLRMPNDGELTLTWARFHAPSGYTLHHLGVLPTICTNNGVQGATPLIGALRDGKLRPVPTLLRNTADPEDSPGLERLRAGCPLRRIEEAVDLQVALALLGDRSLYDRALHLADAPSQTVAAPLPSEPAADPATAAGALPELRP